MRDWVVVSLGGIFLMFVFVKSFEWLWRSSYLKKFAEHDPRGLRNLDTAADMGDGVADHSGDFGGDGGH